MINRIKDIKKIFPATLILILSLTASLALIVFFANFATKGEPVAETNATASGFVNKCSKDSHWKDCYTVQFSKFIEGNTLQDTIDLLGRVQVLDEKTSNCH